MRITLDHSCGREAAAHDYPAHSHTGGFRAKTRLSQPCLSSPLMPPLSDVLVIIFSIFVLTANERSLGLDRGLVPYRNLLLP